MMKAILVVLMLSSVIAFAETPEKPPAPPPDWENSTPKEKPKPTKASSVIPPKEDPEVTFDEGSVGMFKKFAGWVKIIQVIDADNVIVGYGPDADRFLWLSKYSTKGLADDERINLKKTVFQYSGTKTYKTALGASKTVHELKRVSD